MFKVVTQAMSSSLLPKYWICTDLSFQRDQLCSLAMFISCVYWQDAHSELIDSQTLKKRCALVARTEIQ